MTSGREGRAARAGKIAALAAALSLGVSAWEQFLHVALHRATEGSAPHLFVHAGLSLPVAAVAVVIGSRVARRRSSTLGAFAVALLFTVLLVPSVMVHASIHSSEGPRVVHAHGAVFIQSGAAQSLVASLIHGLRDAALGFPAALLIPFAFSVRLRIRVTVPARPLAAGVALAAALVNFPAANVAVAAIPPAYSVPLPIPPVLSGDAITLTADETDVQIMPNGPPTRMWTFNGSFPGPTIRRRSGNRTLVTVQNNLGIVGSQCHAHDPEHGPNDDMCLTLHHHGNHSASSEDGQPSDYLIAPGGSRTYTYEFMEDGAPERAAIQWYHDHRMDVTGRNVWMGLAGMVIVDDDVDNPDDAGRLPLPRGGYDVPLTIVDRSFDANNQLSYNFDAQGVVGNLMLANGAPQPYFEVADVTYRLRILNASNALPIDLQLDNGKPLVQIGTESGLLPAPIVRSHIPLGPAERADVLVNFDEDLNKNVVLKNLLGFGGGTNNVMQFRVVRDGTDEAPIPTSLRPVPQFPLTQVTNARTWVFGRDELSRNWTINGKDFDPDRIDAAPLLGSTETWTFINSSDQVHIVHIHDVDWKVIGRSYGVPPNTQTGMDEAGLKESFWLRPYEIVQVISRFTDHTGKYVLHCHILEHEDRAMMANFEVRNPA